MSRRDFFEQEKKRKMIATFAVAIVLSIVVFVTVFVMYISNLNNEAEENLLALSGENENIVSNDDLEEASYSSDKTVNNSNTTDNSIEVELEETAKNTTNVTKTPENKEPVSSVVKENSQEDEQEKLQEQNNTEKEQESNQELKFEAPVVGEIAKDFAMETLIYSETLDEWCTHSGIDIKAEKSAVVLASESGTVESIKNDPRYGLTVIISHRDGFKTIYSNLLTTEFVQEGEEVEKGQTIATVGETASFEIADSAHLHFEMYNDGNLVNPTIYLK